MNGIRQPSESITIPEDAILIDLREKADYEAGHIPGARMISAETLREEIRRIARFNSLILLYCNTGKRSEQAAEQLRSRGYENARSIGGMDAYTGPLEPELTVRELRAKKGLSQTALARIIGVKQPTVAAYESGKAYPGPEIRGTIRRLLNATICAPDRDAAFVIRKSRVKGIRPRKLQRMTVRELRTACGLTQAKFARSVGICAGSVAAYESGKTRPGDYVAERIREVYGVDIIRDAPDRRNTKEDGKE